MSKSNDKFLPAANSKNDIKVVKGLTFYRARILNQRKDKVDVNSLNFTEIVIKILASK